MIPLEAQFAQFEHVLQILVMDLCGYVFHFCLPSTNAHSGMKEKGGREGSWEDRRKEGRREGRKDAGRKQGKTEGW